MSRHYRMHAEIAGGRPDRIDAIKVAAEEEWPFDDWNEFEGTLAASAEDNLCGGESEEEFTERLSLAIWKANGEYCDVSVTAYYLEELPYELRCLNEEDYERLLKASDATPQGET